MAFTIIELQTTDNVTAVVPPQTRQNENEAKSVWHTIMAAAAISNVEYHAAVILDEKGNSIKKDCYYHPNPPTNQ